MPTRTHDQNILLFGSQNGICGDCGFQFKQTDLRKKWDGLVVCRDCWEPQHPSDLYDYRSRDNGGGAGSSARPDTETESGGTDISGNPIPPLLDINITTLSLGDYSIGVPFSKQIEDDVSSLYSKTYSIQSGGFPSGITLSSSGLVSGTPTADDADDPVVVLLEAGSATDTQDYTSFFPAQQPQAWTTIPNAGSGALPGCHAPYSVFPDGVMISVGGDNSSTGAAKLLDPVTLTWSSAAVVGAFDSRPSSGTVMSDGTFLLYGFHGVCLIYDKDLNTWTATDTDSFNIIELGPPLAAIDGKVFRFGGRNDADGLGVDTVTTYTLSTKSWTLNTNALPKALMFHTACPLSDGRILVGGGTEKGVGNNLDYWFYDPTEDSYTSTTSIPVDYHRLSHCAAIQLQTGEVYIAGGLLSSVATYQSLIFNPIAETWALGDTLLPINCSSANSVSSSRGMGMLNDGRIVIHRFDNVSNSYISVL